jgi:hypothetical protein
MNISLIDLSNIVPAFIYNMFHYVFRWGAFVMVGLGAVLFIVKGLAVPSAAVLVNSQKREIDLRGKIIPFAQVTSITMQSQDMFGKQMTFIILDHQGKKKPFVLGGIMTSATQQYALEQFVQNVNQLVKA